MIHIYIIYDYVVRHNCWQGAEDMIAASCGPLELKVPYSNGYILIDILCDFRAHVKLMRLAHLSPS